MESIIIGMLIGLAGGYFGGLFVAILSRDGIWPVVWLGMILCGAVIGAFGGAFDLLI